MRDVTGNKFNTKLVLDHLNLNGKLKFDHCDKISRGDGSKYAKRNVNGTQLIRNSVKPGTLIQ
jgi:hypothetical protein